MELVYSLILILLTPSINQGDSIDIEIAFSGYGDYNKLQNKFIIKYSPLLFDETDPGFLQSSMGFRDRPDGLKEILLGEAWLAHAGENATHRLKEGGIVGEISKAYFVEDPASGFEPQSGRIPFITSERYYEGIPPLLLRINTSPKTPPGDYDISILFYYSDGTILKLDEEIVTVHIKSPIERHSIALAIIGIMITIIGLPQLTKISDFVIEKLSNLVK